MADTEAPAPAPKEKKRKKSSVKSSEKKAAAAAEGAAAAAKSAAAADQKQPDASGQQNGVSSESKPAESSAPITGEDANILSILSQRPKFTIAGEANVKDAKDDGSKPKVSWSAEDEEERQKQLELNRKKEKEAMEQEKLRELAEAFYLLDFNQDGFICKRDLQMTFSSLGRANMADSDLQRMLDEADSPLDFPAFVKLLGHKTLDLDTEETLVKALAQWDKEGTGFISEARIRHDLMTWGDKFSEEEVDYALEDAPLYSERDGNMIDYVEFCKLLCGLSNHDD